MKNRLITIPPFGEEYFVIDTDQIDSDIEFILSNRISNVIINGLGKYNLNNIDWLERLDNLILKMYITPPSDCNFSYDGLRWCGNIEKLSINNYGKEFIDLINNLNIRYLFVYDFSKIKNFDLLINIENLTINKAKHSLFSESVFRNFTHLKTLSINESDLSDGLTFLKGLSLNTLCLYWCKKLSLLGLNNLSVLELKIDRCKKVEHVDEIYLSHSLTKLSIIDSFIIESSEDLLILNKLDTLIVLGTSYFTNGDLSLFKNKLKYFSFDDKRHYNIKFEEFKKYLKGAGSN
jgi:hypothetical protein